MTVYVISTATASTDFTITERGSLVPIIKDRITINGGANVVNALRITRNSVSTKLTDEQYEKVKEHPLFKRMVDGGFYTVSKQGSEQTQQKVAKDMKKKDKSAPLTPKDLQAEHNEARGTQKLKVKVN